jgi:hypothetical protein
MIVLKPKNIDTKNALRIISTYPEGPKTIQGLIYAGIQGKFITKCADNFHWLVDEDRLKRYCKIINEYHTITSIAKLLGVGTGSIKYFMLKNQISFQIELGRKYLNETDAFKIINGYKGKNNE